MGLLQPYVRYSRCHGQAALIVTAIDAASGPRLRFLNRCWTLLKLHGFLGFSTSEWILTGTTCDRPEFKLSAVITPGAGTDNRYTFVSQKLSGKPRVLFTDI